MTYQHERSDFSVSVKFPNGTSMGITNDFSVLTDSQKDKLKDFLKSVLKEGLGLETVIESSL